MNDFQSFKMFPLLFVVVVHIPLCSLLRVCCASVSYVSFPFIGIAIHGNIQV
jgi:hypothetical protein